MAVQADKRPPDSPSKVQRIYDFSGGLNTTINGSLLNTNEAQVAKNVAFEQKGTLVPLRGRRKRYSSPFAISAISGMGMLYKQDGTSRIIIASGTSVYSDKPNLSQKWDSKADFEQPGTQRTFFVDLDTTNGAIRLKRNYLSRVASDCLATDVYTALGLSVELEYTIKVYNSSSLKATLSTGNTSGKVRLNPVFDLSSPACFAVKVYNGNLTKGLRLTSLKVDGTTEIKTSEYHASVGWGTLFVKLSTAELKELASIAVELSGTAGQYGYMDGLVFYPITQTDYDNASYIPLDFTAFEPTNKTISVDTEAEFNEGTLTDVSNVNGVISCAIGSSQATTIDLLTGTKDAIEVIGMSITIDTKLTWAPYEHMTFDELITL